MSRIPDQIGFAPRNDDSSGARRSLHLNLRLWPRLRSRRGFALIAAIGVLAVLTILATAAVGSTGYTFNVAALQASDRRLGRAIDDATALLASNAPGSPATQATTTSESVMLITPRQGIEGKNDIAVSATLASASGLEIIKPLFGSQPGDAIMVLEAFRRDEPARRRMARLLINTQSQRRTPILLEEARQ